VRPETERDARGDESGQNAGARVEDAEDSKKERQRNRERKKGDAPARGSRPKSDARNQEDQVDKEGHSEGKQGSVVHGQNLRRRPTRAELEAARGKSIPDVIAPRLDVLFVGINPSLWSGAVGLHFARPGNRFWRALHDAGFTDRLLSPHEGRELLKGRIGVTNLVNSATASADELALADFARGARRIAAKVRRYRPKVVAFVGMGAYRVAFGRPRARGGRQEERLAGADIWVLPNPSGRTAGYQMPALARAFRALRRSL
jgi:double-stranded uracil-DNA glycosylase